MENLGEMIKKLRIEKSESQKDLADKIKTSLHFIDKWENNQELPELEIIKKIANHYDISIDFLLNNIPESNLMKDSFYVTFNSYSRFAVWTDFSHNDTIAKKSILDDSRHRTDAKNKNRASNDLHFYVIAVDEYGKIIYAARRSSHEYGAPCDTFYHKKNVRADKVDCFIVEGTYLFYFNPIKETENTISDFEFVIPKNGFVITADIAFTSFYQFMIIL